MARTRHRHRDNADAILAIVGGVLCFALRYMAIEHGWHLPAARRLSRYEENSAKERIG